MGQDSKIQWTHHTFNPWRGCTKVSPGCANCYADALSKRNPKVLGIWGPNGSRVVAAEAMWREPLKWNAEAGELEALARHLHDRPRVFCASLADVFEGADTMPAAALPAVRRARLRLFSLIRATPNLDWLLLTKRPQNIMASVEQAALDCERNDDTCEMLNAWWRGTPPANVWLGASVENQAAADERIPRLLGVPAAVRFLSCEPLLGAVNIQAAINRMPFQIGGGDAGLHWVIVGGESGPGARPLVLGWAKEIVRQCQSSGVSVFVKQIGANATNREGVRHPTRDPKGGDMDEWPEELRVREFPAV